MALYAIGDTHLSLGSNKPMDVFDEIFNEPSTGIYSCSGQSK